MVGFADLNQCRSPVDRRGIHDGAKQVSHLRAYQFGDIAALAFMPVKRFGYVRVIEQVVVVDLGKTCRSLRNDFLVPVKQYPVFRGEAQQIVIFPCQGVSGHR